MLQAVDKRYDYIGHDIVFVDFKTTKLSAKATTLTQPNILLNLLLFVVVIAQFCGLYNVSRQFFRHFIQQLFIDVFYIVSTFYGFLFTRSER